MARRKKPPWPDHPHNITPGVQTAMEVTCNVCLLRCVAAGESYAECEALLPCPRKLRNESWEHALRDLWHDAGR